MAIKSIPWMHEVPPSAGDIAALLASKGRTVGEGGVSVRKRREDDDASTEGASWIIDIDTTSTAAATDIAEWTPPADALIAARADLVAAIQAIRAKAPATRTLAEQAVLALTKFVVSNLS